MIVYELICPGHHRFEGWFSSADDFDSQKARGLLECPTCGHSSIDKLLTAKIGKSGANLPVPAQQHSQPEATAQEGRQAIETTPEQMQKVLDYLLANSENVGKQFAEEARKIHREEAPARSIRGVASKEETQELLEEGVPIMPLPVPPQGEWH